MSPDLPGVELGGPAEGPEPVFVVDATADGAEAVRHLRSLGYEVFQVPQQLLVQRVAVQRPSLVVCNADASGALAAAQQLRAEGVDVTGASYAPISVTLNPGGS